MIRITDLKTNYKQFEQESENVFVVRWYYKDVFDKEEGSDPDEPATVPTDLATWTYERFYFKPSVEDIKQVIIAWCSEYYVREGVSINGHKCVLSKDARAAIKIKCENSLDKITIPCVDCGIILDNKSALQAVIKVNDYYESIANKREELIDSIKKCTSLEDISSLNFDIEMPNDVELTTESLATAAEESEKNSLINQSVLFAQSFINTLELTDEQALSMKLLYPKWESFVGKSLEKGMKVQYDFKLYKVRQTVNPVLENQPPSIHTAALYEEICEAHSGTLEDPIPYNNNMELFEGKYYSQSGVIYKCTRNTGQAVYNNLADLVGIYVEIAKKQA